MTNDEGEERGGIEVTVCVTVLLDQIEFQSLLCFAPFVQGVLFSVQPDPAGQQIGRQADMVGKRNGKGLAQRTVTDNDLGIGGSKIKPDNHLALIVVWC